MVLLNNPNLEWNTESASKNGQSEACFVRKLEYFNIHREREAAYSTQQFSLLRPVQLRENELDDKESWLWNFVLHET